MVLAGKTQAAVSSHGQVQVKTVTTWVKRFLTTGDLRPTPATPPAMGWWEELRQEVQAHPYLFQSEPAEPFGVVQATISKALKPLGRTRKKRRLPIWSKMRLTDKLSSPTTRSRRWLLLCTSMTVAFLHSWREIMGGPPSGHPSLPNVSVTGPRT